VEEAKDAGPTEPPSTLWDTVGAVCIDAAGQVAAGVSSGGILLKFPGRVGEAACPGAGCWAEQSGNNAAGTSASGTRHVPMLFSRWHLSQLLHSVVGLRAPRQGRADNADAAGEGCMRRADAPAGRGEHFRHARVVHAVGLSR